MISKINKYYNLNCIYLLNVLMVYIQIVSNSSLINSNFSNFCSYEINILFWILNLELYVFGNYHNINIYIYKEWYL